MSVQSTSQPPSTPVRRSTTTRASGAWSANNDLTLTTARAKGLNWQAIANNHFPTKTANACRKRHERLMEHRNAENWDDVRLEQLATRYLEHRKEMWSGLADRVGEKWQVVEAKVIETGLRNLTATAKSATRRCEGTEELDSGIGSSEAESSLGSEEVEDSAMADSETHSERSVLEGARVLVAAAAQQQQDLLPPLRSPRRFTRQGPTIASLLLPVSPHA